MWVLTAIGPPVSSAIGKLSSIIAFPIRPTTYDAKLHGHDLACWCPPEEPCHADVLLKVARTPAGVALPDVLLTWVNAGRPTLPQG